MTSPIMTPIPEVTVEAADWTPEHLLAFLDALADDMEAKRPIPGMRLFWQITGHASQLRAHLADRAALEAAREHGGGRRAIADVAAERRRQVEIEGWTPEHDDEHAKGEMALAAACYAMPQAELSSPHSSGISLWRVLWPWSAEWWKPKDRRRDLIRAGALIVAEIERLDRSSALPPAPQDGSGA